MRVDKLVSLLMLLLCAIELASIVGVLCTRESIASESQKSTSDLKPALRPYKARNECRRVARTKLLEIPGCEPVNVTTNACRGFCHSHTIPTEGSWTPTKLLDLDKSYTFEGKNGEALVSQMSDISSLSEYLANLPYTENNVRPTTRKKRNAINLKQESTGEKEVVPSYAIIAEDSSNNYRPIERQPRRSFTDMLPYSLRFGSFLGRSSQSFINDERLHSGGGQDRHRTFKLPTIDSWTQPARIEHHSAGSVDPHRRAIDSVSQCCSMADDEEILITVTCGTINKSISFTSATRCDCSLCQSFPMS